MTRRSDLRRSIASTTGTREGGRDRGKPNEQRSALRNAGFHVGWTVAMLLLLAGPAGCGGDTSQGSEGGCVEGKAISCPCSGDQTGVQVCQSDGTFGTCRCAGDGSTTADAGSADTADGFSSDSGEAGAPDGTSGPDASTDTGGPDADGSRPGTDGGLNDCQGDCESLSTVIAPMTSESDLDIEDGSPVIAEQGPEGGKVFRFEGRENGGFTGRKDAAFSASIDLSKRGVKLEEYDLLKLQVKADRAAYLHVSVDNFPASGRRANWWVLDALRPAFDWKTIYIDLDLPETLGSTDNASPTLHLSGFVKDTGRSIQPDERKFWLGDLRATKQAVGVDWDQRTFTQKTDDQGDVIYEYPVEVTNHLDKSVTARLAIRPYEASSANASLEKTSVSLGPGQQTTVRATLRLPDTKVGQVDPLYTERFTVSARAEGIADSRVTIVRSADPIHLPITVPLPSEKLDFPLFPATPSDLPDSILHFDEQTARNIATSGSPETLIETAKQKGIYNYDESIHVAGYRKTLVAAAYMYDRTGQEKFLRIAETLIDGAAEIWSAQYRKYQNQTHRVVSDGIIVEWKDQWHYTLGLGWRLMGTQRSPYQYSRDANSSDGSMSSIFYAFDIVAPDLDAEIRNEFVRDFAVPAGIRCRNHYIGDGNQQATADSVALYAGLAAENWPLVAFAHSSHHSVPSVIKWTFTDEGVHIRDGYQKYTLRPIFWTGELLDGVGVDLYGQHRQRLQKAVDQAGGMYFWDWVRQTRL